MPAAALPGRGSGALTPNPSQERWALALAAAVVAVLFVVAPAGYVLVSMRYQAGALETEAAAVAGAVDGLVAANPDLWRFEQIRLEEILQRRVAPGAPPSHVVLDLEGNVVARNGVEVEAPALRRSAPILDAGVPRGRVDVATSARPAVLGALVLAAALAPLAAGALLLVRSALRRAAAARAAAEAQLREAQRLEAVGRLAGGVAHDYNNLLAVVLSSARELRRELPPGAAHLETVDDILSASERAAQITRRLLTFARQEPLGLRRADARDVIRDLERSVRETLAGGQTLELDLGAEPLPVDVDPVQLELVLVNLAGNARDAMPPLGRLRIETSAETRGRSAALAPGAYVRIAVRDDGAGMSGETRRRAFDPFFTTKAVGRGRGLGLAIAHGVLQQHRGAIEVESAPGQGTTVTLLLPRAAGEPDALPAGAQGALDG